MTVDGGAATGGSGLLLLILGMAYAACALAAFDAGLQLRQTVWALSESTLRFMGDVRGGWSHGEAVLDLARSDALARGEPQEPVSWSAFFHGFRASYDDIVEQAPDGDYRLDYPPLRLLVMSYWVKHIDGLEPGVSEMRDEFVTPLLALNTVCALVAAIIAGIIVYRAVRRKSEGGLGETPSLLSCALATVGLMGIAGAFALAWHRQNAADVPAWALAGVSTLALLWSIARLPNAARALSSALLAALLLWFNPAILLDGHAWPQWDTWPLPFLLISIFCMTMNLPFLAGFVFVIGAMLKGQILLVAPMLVLWPVMSSRSGESIRVLIGAATATAMITAIWLLPTRSAWVAVTVAVALAVVMVEVINRGGWMKRGGRPVRIPLGATAAGVFAGSTFLVGDICGGSFSWLRVGFEYGVNKFDKMHQRGTSNLATILADGYGWRVHDLVRLPIPGAHGQMEIKTLLAISYAVCLVLSCIAVGLLSRKRDPRMFVALTAPFVCFYALLAQMHSRYLMFGAAVSCLCVSAGTGGTLLSLATTILAALPILHLELIANPDANPDLLQWLDVWNVALSYATVVLAGIFMAYVLKLIAEKKENGVSLN